MEQNIINTEEVAVEATEEVVKTGPNSFVKALIIGGGIALTVFGIGKLYKVIKNKIVEAKAKKEAANAIECSEVQSNENVEVKVSENE